MGGKKKALTNKGFVVILNAPRNEFRGYKVGCAAGTGCVVTFPKFGTLEKLSSSPLRNKNCIRVTNADEN